MLNNSISDERLALSKQVALSAWRYLLVSTEKFHLFIRF